MEGDAKHSGEHQVCACATQDVMSDIISYLNTACGCGKLNFSLNIQVLHMSFSDCSHQNNDTIGLHQKQRQN